MPNSLCVGEGGGFHVELMSLIDSVSYISCYNLHVYHLYMAMLSNCNSAVSTW